jgi:hypothetical protein
VKRPVSSMEGFMRQVEKRLIVLSRGYFEAKSAEFSTIYDIISQQCRKKIVKALSELRELHKRP